MRKILRRTPVVLALLAVLAVAVVGTASATGSSAGKTVLTTNPDTTKVLVKNLIVPLPVGGAGFGVASLFPPSLKYSFPITGISGGVIGHSGGMKFVNARNFKSATIRNFDIDTNTAKLRADVDGVGNDVEIADLTFTSGTSAIVKINAAAASVLNGALGTSIFSAGLTLGTAQVFPPA
jgi:hypothetical protein